MAAAFETNRWCKMKWWRSQNLWGHLLLASVASMALGSAMLPTWAGRLIGLGATVFVFATAFSAFFINDGE